LLERISIVLAPKKSPADNQAIGRSRGGLTTKIHTTCDALGNPTGFSLTSGESHDLDGFDALQACLTQAQMVLADKAYDADERVRDKLKENGCIAVIPYKKTRLQPLEYDKHIYKLRHLIENVFAKLKQFRGIATRYDKLAKVFLGAVYMAAITVWLK
jgi:transposase